MKLVSLGQSDRPGGGGAFFGKKKKSENPCMESMIAYFRLLCCQDCGMH